VALATALLVAACAPRTVPCEVDSDCPDGLCLADLDRGDRYCSLICSGDADCAQTQRCDVHLTGAPGDEDVLSLCVERVRSCGEGELCNGLDDDCDGEIDDDCVQTRCSDDLICGGVWPCAPARDDPGADFVCLPPREGAALPGAACAPPPDCYNDQCVVGVCAPLCRSDEGCSGEERCAEPSSPGYHVRHTSCHRACDAVSACPEGMACTLRPLPSECRWRAVCSPVRGAAALGASCAAHDDCASTLCVLGRCTVPCATFVDCQGLWPGSSCEILALAPDIMACPLVEVAACQ